MPSEPLSLLILLFFVLMIATALALWFLLTLGRGKREVESVDFFQRAEPKKPLRPPPSEVKNDEVRGARAQHRDPFERDRAEPHRAEPERAEPERAEPERAELQRKQVRDDQTQSDRDKRDAFESFSRAKSDELDF